MYRLEKRKNCKNRSEKLAIRYTGKAKGKAARARGVSHFLRY